MKCPPNKSQSPSEVAIKTPYTDSSSDKDTTENNAKLGASEMRNESDLPNQPRDSNPPIKLERVSPNQANNRSEYRPKYDRESTTSRLEGTRLSTRKASTDRTVENSLSKSPKSYPNTLHESPSKSNRFHNSSEDEMAEADWKTGDKWERTVLTQNHVTINKDIKSSGGMSYVEQSMTFEGSRTRNGEGIAYVSRTELDGSVEQPASNLQICSPSKLDKLPSLLSRSPTPVTFTSPSFENGDGRQVGHQSLLGQFEALKCKVTGKFDEKRLAQFLNVIEKARSTQPFNTMFPGYGELDASKLEENQACTEVWLEAMFDVHLPESDKFDASKPEEIRALKLAATAFQSYMIGRQNAVISPQPLDQSVRLSPTVQQREYDQLRKSPDVEKRSPRTKSTRSEVTSTKNETASSSLHECQPTSGLPADNNPVDISGLNSLFYQKIYAQRGYTLRSTLALALLAIGKGKISAEMAADWMKENLPTVHQRYEDGASLKRSLNTTLYNKKEKWFDKLPGDSKAKNEFRFEVGVQQKFLDDYVLPYITLHKGQAINGSKMAQTVLNKASSSSHISFVSGNTSRNSSASKSATTLNTSSSIETETLQTSGISTNRLLNGNHSSEDDSFLGNDGLAIVTSTPALNRQVRMAGTFNDMTSAKSIVSNRIPRRENLTGLSDGKARILQDKEVNLSNEDAGDVEMRNVSNEEPARAIGSQMEPVSGAEPDVMDVDEEGDNSEDSTDDFKSIIQIYSPTMKLRQQFPTEIFKEGSNLSLEGQIPKPTLKLTSSARRISRKDGFQKLLSTARSYRSNIHQETTWRQRSRESPEIAGNSSIVQERADPDKSIQDLSVFVPSRYQNIWEALDIPKQAIPMLHDNKLAFRSGQKVCMRTQLVCLSRLTQMFQRSTDAFLDPKWSISLEISCNLKYHQRRRTALHF